MSHLSLLEEVCDDILIYVCKFLKNDLDVLNLSFTSRAMRFRMIECINNFSLLMSSLNYHLLKLPLIKNSNQNDLNVSSQDFQDLPNLIVRFINPCKCLMFFTKLSKNSLFPKNCKVVRHPSCNSNHIRIALLNQMNININNNTIKFYHFESPELFYYEFTNNGFHFNQNRLPLNVYSDNLLSHGNFVRFMNCYKSYDGFFISSFDFEIQHKYESKLIQFERGESYYYPCNLKLFSPLNYVVKIAKTHEIQQFWIADYKKLKFYHFNLKLKLNHSTPFFITTKDEIILSPRGDDFTLFNDWFHPIYNDWFHSIYKYDMLTKLLFKTEIKIKVGKFCHTGNTRRRIAIGELLDFSPLTDNLVQVCQKGFRKEHFFWFNLDTVTWTQLEQNSLVQVNEEPLLLSD